jgi:hypothetical protein
MTKQFKKKNQYYVPKLFLNAMIKNIKIHNIFYIIKISKFMYSLKYIFNIFI